MTLKDLYSYILEDNLAGVLFLVGALLSRKSGSYGLRDQLSVVGYKISAVHVRT